MLSSRFLFLGVDAQTGTWDGTVSAWTQGNGTESNLYLIESALQLAYSSQQVIIGQGYEKKYFRLETDIDLNNLE